MLPLDISGVICGYGFNKLKTGYSGFCLRVRRASDNSTADIGFDASGVIDNASLLSFCSGTDGYINIWYDQSDNSDPMEQNTLDNQPKIVDNGSIITDIWGNQVAHFYSDYLECTTSNLVYMRDVCAYWAGCRSIEVDGGGAPYNDAPNMVIYSMRETTHTWDESYSQIENHKFIRMYYKAGTGSAGQLGDAGNHYYTHYPGVQIFNVSGDYVGSYTGNIRIKNATITTADVGNNTNRLFLGNRRGGYTDFYLNSYVVTSGCSHTKRTEFCDAILDVYPVAVKSDHLHRAGLYQRFPWQKTMYDWLSGITLDDVNLPLQPIQWDDTYNSMEQLLTLWRYLYSETSYYNSDHHTRCMRNEPNWHVLNDGSGKGIACAYISSSGLGTFDVSGQQVICSAPHGLTTSDHIKFTTTGTLPSGIEDYYVYKVNSIGTTPTGAAPDKFSLRYAFSHGEVDFTSSGVGDIYWLETRPRLQQSESSQKATSIARQMFFYRDLDIPTASGQGNPYFHSSGLAMRALVDAFADIFNNDEGSDRSPSYFWDTWCWGGHVVDCFEGIDDLFDYLPSGVQEACVLEGLHAVRAWKITGSQYLLGNLVAKSFPTIGHIYSIANKYGHEECKQTCLEAFKYICFGSSSGSIGNNDKTIGSWSDAGYISEGRQPETTYNGRSLFDILYMWQIVHEYEDWSFLSGMIHRMCEWKISNYFENPSGVDRPARKGPSGWGARTGGDMISDQQGENGRNVVIGTWFTPARPITRTSFGGALDRDVSTLLTNINSRYNYYNNWLTLPHTGIPPTLNKTTDSHWPGELAHKFPSGWYDEFAPLYSGNDPSTFTYWHAENSGVTVNENIGGADEFWVYKNNHNGREFGWQIEAIEDPGVFAAWFGGQVHTFWINDMGPIILSRKNGSGGDYDDADKENTRYWPHLEKWACFHIWGRDDASIGNSFSTAPINQTSCNQTSTFDISGGTKSVTYQMDLGRATTIASNFYYYNTHVLTSGVPTTITHSLGVTTYFYKVWRGGILIADTYAGYNPEGITFTPVNNNSFQITVTQNGTYDIRVTRINTNRGMETAQELENHYSITKTFTALASGLQITQVISKVSGAVDDKISELWASFPIFLGDPYGDAKIIYNNVTCEYWTGSGWTPLNSGIVETNELRIGQDWTDPLWPSVTGIRYAYCAFNTTRRVRWNENIFYQEYQGDERCRNIDIDLHGNPGTDIDFNGTRTLTFSLLTEPTNLPVSGSPPDPDPDPDPDPPLDPKRKRKAWGLIKLKKI